MTSLISVAHDVCVQVDRDEAKMKDADKPAPVSFKKLKSTKSDISGVGKVGDCALLLHTYHAV